MPRPKTQAQARFFGYKIGQGARWPRRLLRGVKVKSLPGGRAKGKKKKRGK